MSTPRHDLYDAVIFDLGGVVLPSPFEAWATYEQELGLPIGFIRRAVAGTGESGAWARHERGELPFIAFIEAFEAECAGAGPGGEQISAVEVMTRIGTGAGPRPEMVRAIRAIRQAGLKTAALTNNWVPVPVPPPDGGVAEAEPDDAVVAGIGALEALGPLFDLVVESAVEGLRKPDPRIYQLVCDRLAVEPIRAVFLDDLGMNLKPARALGMTTIKVDDPRDALSQLASVLGLPSVTAAR